MPRGLTYDDTGRRSQMTAPPSSDPFGTALLSLLDDARDVASEKVWQEIPRLIAAQWQSFTAHQSPLSTMGMIARACETVLKIRLASRKGGGEEEAKRLEEFQALMADIWGRESDEEPSMPTPQGDADDGEWSVSPAG